MDPEQNPIKISCPQCRQTFKLKAAESARFCPLCGSFIGIITQASPNLESTDAREVLSNRYQLIKSIGKGGMGEVFLAFDSICLRSIALKKIRSDLLGHPQIRRRFLKEAHITCQLTHPAIIPIYSIQSSQLCAYYTMPFVEGETLKQVVRKIKQKEKKGEKIDRLEGAIPAFMRIFITICQAVAYSHSKGFLHRDLKPENVIIGKYGEVLILDWGLAKHVQNQFSEDETQPDTSSPQPPGNFQHPHANITRLGKVVGTVAYMAPERALGQPATVQTDIYALGVILYQLLTLKMPFKRKSLEEFRKNMEREEWIDPVVAAPYRDVPKILAEATAKCLTRSHHERYRSVDDLIYDLESYLEGRSEWFHVADLTSKNKEDWEFQENVLIADHLAITRGADEAEWVNLMISRRSFSGNTRVETSVRLSKEGRGIGILLSVPEASERKTITDGYCLWLGSGNDRTTRLLRSNVEVMQAPDIFLKKNQWTRIRLEKIDNSIHLYLDNVLQFSYIAHLPLIGTHIGLMSRDADFEMKPLQVFVGSLNLNVNCLAVPDAFLAHRDFTQALSEYHRIAYSFPDRAEGREAIFRAGLTYIEQAKGADEKGIYLDRALEEFEKLHGTPGGPLEYLGKALVYQTLCDVEEEIKCFEIAYRRYPRHPLLPMLQEQILSRMHEVSRRQRMAAYQFILLSVRHLPSSALDTHTQRLFAGLQRHWEHLPFIEEHSFKNPLYQLETLGIPLAFWLAKPFILEEIIDALLLLDQPPGREIANALAALIELGCKKVALKKIDESESKNLFSESSLEDLHMMIDSHQSSLQPLFQKLFSTANANPDFFKMRTMLHLLDRAIDLKDTSLISQALQALEHCEMNFETRLRFNERKVWGLLLEKNWQRAREVFYTYPVELLNKDSTLLHFLYGCWLIAAEGKEMAIVHFTGLLHAAYPRTWTLASHEINGDLLKSGWFEKAFLYEKRQLYRQLSLYHHCAGQELLSQKDFQIAQGLYLYDEAE